ncbi:DgyrCDS2204 [Dimorphilus gyrociliatus]|uniref:DgyrCDS2204 n=1 Tax=Dimorphilus gyrociliatus TaxID=2664684 RepID=A0A7I8VCM0_9ANNE|nr:DgyrCDS2204 [Dimorphilus gyrociliatus]
MTTDSQSLSLELTTAQTSYQCTLFGGNQHKCNTVIGIKKATALLSLLGSIFVICTIILFGYYKVFVQRLLLYLSISGVLLSISYLVGGMYPEGNLCNFQAWMMTCFEWSVLLWVCLITLILYKTVVSLTSMEKWELLFCCIGWIFPFVIACIPLIAKAYGQAGIWWSNKTWEGTYDPDAERRKKFLKDEVKPLMAYPFIYLVLSIFPLINRIQNAISNEPVFALMVLTSLTSPLYGAIYAVVFGVTDDLRKRLTWSGIKFVQKDLQPSKKTRRDTTQDLMDNLKIPTRSESKGNSASIAENYKYNDNSDKSDNENIELTSNADGDKQINIQLNGLLNNSHIPSIQPNEASSKTELDSNYECFDYKKADKKEEVDLLDKRLSIDKLFKSKLREYLARQGGNEARHIVYRVMKAIGNKSAWCQFNWEGSRGIKKGIKSLPSLLKVIEDASLESGNNAKPKQYLTIEEIEGYIKQFLRFKTR